MTESESATVEPPQAQAQAQVQAQVQTQAVVDLLLRPAAFFGERRLVIRDRVLFGVILTLSLASLADRYPKVLQRKPEGPEFLLGMGLGMLVVAGPMRWVVGSLLFQLRLYWSGARNIDTDRAAAIFGLSEMVMAVPLVLWTIADLVFAPAGHAFSPTLLLAMAWSTFVAYQGVRCAFVVVRWRALLWFVILPGLLRGLLLWKL